MLRLIQDWFAEGVAGWNRFWFTPTDPATLALVRICGGAMLFYTHLIWSLRLEAFFGPSSWITPEAAHGQLFREGAWSYFFWIDSPLLLWFAHLAALVVFALLTVGLFTKVTAPLAALAAVSYANRVPGALFGLDDTNVMLALYLAVGAGGQCYSLDAWRARRTDPNYDTTQPSLRANLGIRLIQIHLCIVYLFSGIGKLLGPVWWNGGALWGAIANQEYQSLDVTGLVNYPNVIDALTHMAIFWEVFYCALIWPRWTRPIALAMAVGVHGGIALVLGMKTFGLVMIIANMAFLPTAFVRRILQRRAPAASQ